MEDKKHKISLVVKKEGKEPKNWIKMETVSDIFNQAMILND